MAGATPLPPASSRRATTSPGSSEHAMDALIAFALVAILGLIGSSAIEPLLDEAADRVAKSVCPYCAVGCAQNVYVKDEKIVQIEGNPDSPVNRGRLCPKGSASKSLVTSPTRVTKVRYRRPNGTEWEDLELDTAMEMIADRVVKARNDTWQDLDEHGRKVRRTLGIASLGGATLDNEENYLIKKLFTAMGAIQIENQARI